MSPVIDFKSRKPRQTEIVVFFGTKASGVDLIVRTCGERLGASTGFLTETELTRTEDCDRCELKEKLLGKINRVITEEKCETLVLRAHPELDPQVLAEVLLLDDVLQPLPNLPYRIRSFVTVIDVREFWLRITQESDTRARVEVTEAYANQIEVTDEIWVTGAESEREFQEAQGVLKTLQPRAKIEKYASDVSFGQSRFDLEVTLNGYGVRQCVMRNRRDSQSFVYRRKKPFHPERLFMVVESWPEGVLRSKGTLWVASQNDLAFSLSQFGPASLVISPEGLWVDTLTDEERDSALELNPVLLENFDSKFGDRVNEIAFIGEDLKLGEIESVLDSCLLSELEMRMNWSRFKDPFRELFGEGDQIADLSIQTQRKET